MEKETILREIVRTAQENNGVPVGFRKFEAETGIKYHDWFGVHWPRWNDAVREAGFAPNQLTTAYGNTELLEKYAQLAHDLGRLPAKGDLRLRSRNDPDFPNDKTFDRLGAKSDVLKAVVIYCETEEKFEDVIRLCRDYVPRKNSADEPAPQNIEIGFVYLIRSGRYYKVGKSNAVGRREREITLQLPERARTIHTIRTDDPTGIEVYWHNRFAVKRKNGEWFDLSPADIAAFRRRKTM